MEVWVRWYAAYLPLGRVTVQARLGGAGTPALSVVNVWSGSRIGRFLIELDEFVQVVIRGTEGIKRGVELEGSWRVRRGTSETGCLAPERSDEQR